MDLNQVIYFNQLQHITVDENGSIISTNSTLFDLNTSNSIYDFNPVFQTTIQQLKDENVTELLIPGLNLNLQEKQLFCDVRLKKENGYIVIMLFNFTSKYKEILKDISHHNKTEIERNKKVHANHKSLIS